MIQVSITICSLEAKHDAGNHQIQTQYTSFGETNITSYHRRLAYVRLFPLARLVRICDTYLSTGGQGCHQRGANLMSKNPTD
jgi:hypothetical protein